MKRTSTVRKTVKLDADVYAAIKKLQKSRGVRMKNIVNEALTLGIEIPNDARRSSSLQRTER